MSTSHQWWYSAQQHNLEFDSLICISSTNYLGLVDGKSNKRLGFICLLNHLFVSASANSSAAGPQIWQCNANAVFTIYYHWDPCGHAAGGDNWCNKSSTHTTNVHRCEQKSLSHMGLVMFAMGHSLNTSMLCYDTVHYLYPGLLEKVISNTVPVYWGTLRMRCGSNDIHMRCVWTNKTVRGCSAQPTVTSESERLHTVDVEVEKSSRWSLLASPKKKPKTQHASS